MRTLLLTGFLFVLAHVGVNNASAVPQAQGPTVQSQSVKVPHPVCGLGVFGKGMYNGTYCQPFIDLYEKNLAKNPCAEGCVLVPSKERGRKNLPKGQIIKVGDECDWALYDCRDAEPTESVPAQPIANSRGAR